MSTIRSEVIERLVPRVFGGRASSCTVKPLRGGLEAAVAIVDVDGECGRRRAVVKRLEGHARREVPLYRAIAGNDVAPEVYGAAEEGSAAYLFIEYVRPVERWPWRNTQSTALVLRQLARVHDLPHVTDDEAGWDYESALLTSAMETLHVAESWRSAVPEVPLGTHLRPLKRVAEALPGARVEMREKFGTVLLHGDAHPGNVILRERRGERRALFLDWGRSRSGSPLEDVSSWLQTLRHWEPAAAQRHDALFREYLSAAGRDPALDSTLRDAYWIASASNVLAGALRYHIVRIPELKGVARAKAAAQARDALRIIRRADAALRV